MATIHEVELGETFCWLDTGIVCNTEASDLSISCKVLVMRCLGGKGSFEISRIVHISLMISDSKLRPWSESRCLQSLL